MTAHKPTTHQVAQALAKAYAPDLLPAELSHTAAEQNFRSTYSSDPRPRLDPGMDWHDGTLYLTVPHAREGFREEGRGKAKIQVPTQIIDTICVTSQHDWFVFNEDEVWKRGFAWPATFAQNTNQAQWTHDSTSLFIEQSSDTPDPFELYRDIRKVYEQYVEFSDERHYDLMTLYAMMTYVFRLFTAVPYIHFNGTANAGKSQNMAILSALAFNPIWQADISPASLFRIIGGSCGTIMIDEAEDWDSDSNKELLRIIKAGYIEGAGVMRTERNKSDKFETINYPAFSPKVMASIAPQDLTLTSRMIVVNMRPALRRINKFNRKDPRWQPIRDRLYLWSLNNAAAIDAIADEWEHRKRLDYDIQNREWQLAHPLLTIADHVAGELLVKPMAEWLAAYWAEQHAQATAIDKQALLLRCLPRTIADHAPVEDKWYLLKDIHASTIDYIDPDQRDKFVSRTVSKMLVPLGFAHKRNSKQGTQIWIEEDDVRAALNQRRLDPFPEDVDWLAGTTTYYQTPPTTQASADLWTSGEADDATG